MAGEMQPGRQDGIATALGWAIFVVFLVLLVNIIWLPRTAIDQRQGLQMYHDSLGFLLLALVLVRLAWWLRAPAPRPPAGLPPASFNFNRALLLALFLTFAAEGLIGPLYAWAEGRNVGFFGAYLPRLTAPSEGLRMATGYLHSSLAFYYLMLGSLWLCFTAYQHFRYRVGLRRMWPGTAV